MPAYLVLVLAVAGLMSFPLGMVEYRSRGFLKPPARHPGPARAPFLAAQVVVNAASVCWPGSGC